MMAVFCGQQLLRDVIVAAEIGFITTLWWPG
jgi:hypothetical protein